MLTHEHKIFTIGGSFRPVGQPPRIYSLQTVLAEVDGDPEWDGWELLAVLTATMDGATLLMRRARAPTVDWERIRAQLEAAFGASHDRDGS